jgi:hypothetical protein
VLAKRINRVLKGKGAGNAHAGEAARAEDASTVFFNLSRVLRILNYQTFLCNQGRFQVMVLLRLRVMIGDLALIWGCYWNRDKAHVLDLVIVPKYH